MLVRRFHIDGICFKQRNEKTWVVVEQFSATGVREHTMKRVLSVSVAVAADAVLSGMATQTSVAAPPFFKKRVFYKNLSEHNYTAIT